MVTVLEILARIIGCDDQLQSRHSHEVEFIRNGTRHIHCRLHSFEVSAGDFLTTPCSLNVPIENGANVRPPRAPSLMRTFTTGKGNSRLLYIIYQYPAFIDELRDWQLTGTGSEHGHKDHSTAVSCQFTYFPLTSSTSRFLSSNPCDDLIKPFKLHSLTPSYYPAAIIATHFTQSSWWRSCP